MVNDRNELARQMQVSRTAKANHARYQPGQRAGHYESFFLRANHPARLLAFYRCYENNLDNRGCKRTARQGQISRIKS